MPDVHQLVYVSIFNSGRVENALKSLREIVSVSRKNNQRTGITGYLIFDGEAFLQILEGDESAVDSTYATIGCDARHRDVRLIGRLKVAERGFRDWSMAGYLRRPAESAIFARHGASGPIAETTLSTAQAIALATSLATKQLEPVEA